MSQYPTELVYDTIWDLLEANSGFVAEVAVGNRIKFYDDKTRPLKDEVSNADLPEVRVICLGLRANPYSDSNMSSLRMRFAVQISTGQQKMDKLLRLQWLIFCSLLNWDTVLQTLTWNSKTFVSSCNILDSSDSLHNNELNRGIMGWSSVWQGEIECHFETTVLRSFEGT